MMEPTMLQVAIATAAYYEISVSDLAGPDRSRRVSWPRQVAFCLTQKLVSGASLPAIGRQYNRDHTTVIHGINAVADRNRQDERMAMIEIGEVLEKANSAFVFKSRRNPPKFQTTRNAKKEIAE